MSNHKDEWGNIELPGVSDDLLLNPNLNKILANREKAKDPVIRKKLQKIQNSTEFKTRISETSFEKWKDPSFREKNSNSKKKTWATNEVRRQQVIEQFSQSKTESHKKNISEATKRFAQTPEGKQVLKQKADAQRGKPRRIEKCPHCGKEGGEGIMHRWHFDNCKHKN